MSPVYGTCSWNMELSECDMKGKSKRKRRRRCKGKGWSNTVSPFISPIHHWDSAASSAEDADNSSTSSLEVKENQVEKNQLEHNLLRKYHPSIFCATFPRQRPRAPKRKQSLVDRKDWLLCQSHGACKRAAWAVTQKNALVQLNELRPGLQYEIVSKTGPLHAPVFSVGVEVNGFHFEGQGTTKKQAKLRAAELALQSFIQFPNASQVHTTMGNFTSTPMDFTADQLDLPDAIFKEFESSLHENCDLLHCSAAKEEVFSSLCNHRWLVRFSLDLVSTSNPKRRDLSTSLSPVALLNELRPGLRYTCLTERVHGRPMRNFIMVLKLEGRVFEGCGHSKRLAKTQAAAAALESIYNISLGPEKKIIGLQGSRTKNQLPQVFAESIYHLVREKYTQLTDNRCSTSLARHKVLAGIVMTRGFDLRSAQVVSLATGTKCLELHNISDHGCTLSDCHAEVICRRALVRFLYSQLDLMFCEPEEGEEQSIFVPHKGCSGGFRLQDDIFFHMYVSSSPCGDARLNCPYETTVAYPSRRFRCHLRMKVNGGEGTLPVMAQRANQKVDCVSQSKPFVTMSCTDKIAKWSALGLQGALLSHLVEPVYLHSLTVGTLSHTGHLERAMARRLASVEHLPFPYRRKQLLLGCLSSRELRPAGKAPSVSLNWSCGDGGLEEVCTVTGRRKDSGTLSRLCRRSLFTRWLKLQKQLNGPISGAETTAVTYSVSKMAAGRYQRAVQQFGRALEGGGLGMWLRKPQQLSHFSISQ
ncbi:double-stranded RNA-specific editase B2-like [Melanotaenia boesemani]|uniref:double-stranded RNA-specific editase B2-like n=1 Tax=Melanotaenia boesemani TaxID=1250792 RepID=UPI001C04B00E|nr:double-stranded RNA-specific editase B2-like [Melanotaenia boesemani]